MPTTAQIENANPTLSELVQAQITALIRSSARYQEQPGRYPNLGAKLTEADGTIKVQQLNAALALIDSVGDGTVAIKGSDDGLDYMQTRDRDQLIGYMLDVLYDQPVRKSAVATGVMKAGGSCPRCGWPLNRCGCRPWC